MSLETSSNDKTQRSAKVEGKGDFFDRLQSLTETFLTHRKRNKRIKKEKQRRKNILVDWLEAFLWAAGVVLLINQYLFQVYQIPSGSMIDTLLVGDRIFVNKIVYGPELLPGLGKLPSPIKPKRNDIIIFENPSYISQGPVFEIAQRIIFMLTLSFVDIDREENGEPKAHFLIKRAVAMGGDWVAQERGNLRFRLAGESRWIDETEFNASRGITHNVSRLLSEGDYTAIEARGKAEGYAYLQLPPPSYFEPLFASYRYPDSYAQEKATLEIIRGARPHESQHSARLAQLNQGWYVPESRILPLGDNRDNSRDGRSFGPVKSSRILGRGSFIFWPGDFSTRRFAAFDRFGFMH